jgi:hypothetical protein
MVTRRGFLIAAAGAVVAHATTIAISAQRRTPCTGVMYGRTGRKGMRAGASAMPSNAEVMPSNAEVVLLDGTSVQVAPISEDICPNKSVLLSPDPQGGWSVLYAEF